MVTKYCTNEVPQIHNRTLSITTSLQYSWSSQSQYKWVLLTSQPRPFLQCSGSIGCVCCLGGLYGDKEPQRSDICAGDAGTVSTQKCCSQNLQWRTVTVDVIVEGWQYPSSAKWVRSTRNSKLATMEYNSQEICDFEKDEREALCLFKALLPGVRGKSIKTF